MKYLVCVVDSIKYMFKRILQIIASCFLCLFYTTSQQYNGSTQRQSNVDPHRRARAPLLYLWMVTAAQRILQYLTRSSHPLIRLWMMTAAARSRSDLSRSRRATWPARKNTLVFPKQYCSGSGISWGRSCLHKAWARSWFWGPRSKIWYLLKNSSYVHLDRQIQHKILRTRNSLI